MHINVTNKGVDLPYELVKPPFESVVVKPLNSTAPSAGSIVTLERDTPPMT